MQHTINATRVSVSRHVFGLLRANHSRFPPAFIHAERNSLPILTGGLQEIEHEFPF